MKMLHSERTWRTFAMLAALLLAATAAHAAERAIDKTVDVNASVDDVWDAWTTRAGIVSFFAPDAKIEPRVGGAFEVYIDPEAPPGSIFERLSEARALSRQWSLLTKFTYPSSMRS